MLCLMLACGQCSGLVEISSVQVLSLSGGNFGMWHAVWNSSVPYIELAGYCVGS